MDDKATLLARGSAQKPEISQIGPQGRRATADGLSMNNPKNQKLVNFLLRKKWGLTVVSLSAVVAASGAGTKWGWVR
jgi:hypothetical protein